MNSTRSAIKVTRWATNGDTWSAPRDALSFRIDDCHRSDDLVRIGIRLRPEHLRSIVRHFGDIQVARGIDVDLVDAVELARQGAVPADVENVVAVKVVLDQAIRSSNPRSKRNRPA